MRVYISSLSIGEAGNKMASPRHATAPATRRQIRIGMADAQFHQLSNMSALSEAFHI